MKPWVIKTWFQNSKINKLDWAPQSPDMNPMENVWNRLENQLRRELQPTNTQQLKDAILEEWNKIPESYLSQLVDSMPRRVSAVISAKGG